jgi:mannitol/fructose-specific phosphotransferase system IIA component (Ntr-type)
VLLSELIQEDLIELKLEASNKWDAIEELVDLLISAHELRLTNRSEVVDAVFTRERSLSTGLEHGLAVPHGAVDCAGDILAAVGLSKAGIPFDSLDGQPARLIVLLVIPRGAAQRHVRTLAGIARLASNPDLRSKILSADSASEILEAIYLFEQQEESAEE